VAKKKTGLGIDAFFRKPETADKNASTPADQQTQTKAEDVSAGETEKTKATYYLSNDTVVELEEAWLRLRRLMATTIDKDKRRQVSKSWLVESALQIALEELERKGADS